MLLTRMLGAVAVSAVLSLPFADAAGAQITLRAGSVLPGTSDQGQAAEYFATRVAELTNGEVIVQVFHGGEIGTPPVQYDNLVAGAQDMVIDTSDYLAAFDPRMGVLNTPFLFRDRAHFQAFLNSDAFQEIRQSVEGHGMVFLTDFNWMRQQNRGLLTRSPIATPEELRGFRLRMFQAEMPIRAWSEMGASVQVVAWGEVYTALATGAVDGLTTPLAVAYNSNFTELLDYFTDLGEYFQVVIPIVSSRTWGRLSDEHRAALAQAAQEAGEVYVRLSREMDDTDVRSAMENHNVQFVEPDMDAWFAAAAALHERLIAARMLDPVLLEAIAAIE